MDFSQEQGMGVNRFVQDFLYRVYGWMSVGLILTASVAYWIASTPEAVKMFYSSPWIMAGLMIAQLGAVIGLSAGINRLSFGTSAMIFVAYSILTGLTFSYIFLVYTQTSIFSTFLVTAGMFGGMSLYGYVTKSDLSGMGNILLMALFGLILSMFVNFWLKSPEFSFLISGVGVLIFTLLTAYDVQKLKRNAQMMSSQGQSTDKIVITGALILYLDFINLFIYLLRFMGQRRND
jgi:uncharacterized protein